MNEPTELQSSQENNRAESDQNLKKPKGTIGKKNGLFLIIILFVSLIFFSRHESIVTIDCTPDIIAKNPDIIMLGAWWCSYCYQAKTYFQHNNIHYCEYDMENTTIGKQLYQKHGGGLPVLLVGKYQLNGFSKRQIESALSLLNK